MKKTSVIILLMIVCTAFCAFAQNGVLEEISGMVEIMRPGTRAFTAAKNGDEVTPQTVISTGFRSYAKIKVGHSVIAVQPVTRLTLTEIQAAANSETLNVNLRTGRIRVDLKPPSGSKASATYQTPSAVASVRGTRFDLDTRNIHVHEGRVDFTGRRGQTVIVKAGGKSQIGAGSKAANPIETRTAALTPPAPAGTASGGGTITTPVPTSGDYTFELVLP